MNDPNPHGPLHFSRDVPRLTKHKCHVAVREAVASGALIPSPCVVCGAKAVAHHDDYALPLDVIWLCPKHHGERHALLGFNSGKRGGRRANQTGRPRRGTGLSDESVTVRMTSGERGELEAALAPGESIMGFVRDAALDRARSRRKAAA